MRPDATVRGGVHGRDRETQRVDGRALELGSTDTIRRRERPGGRAGKAVDTAADVARAAGVRFTGCVPECLIRAELEVTRRERRQGVRDRLPVATAGRRAPDAAVGGSGVDVAEAVGSQAGDAPGDETGATTRVGEVVAVVRVVCVVRDLRDVTPRSARCGEPAERSESLGVPAGSDNARRCACLSELRRSRGEVVRLTTAAAVRSPLIRAGAACSRSCSCASVT